MFVHFSSNWFDICYINITVFKGGTMSNQINIYNLTVNGVTQNANINIGRTLQNSHTSNLKLYGANFSMGDFSPAHSLNITKVQAQETSDQGQMENPSSADK